MYYFNKNKIIKLDTKGFIWKTKKYMCILEILFERRAKIFKARLLCSWDFPARILEWNAIFSSRASSWLKDRTHVSCIVRNVLYHWANHLDHYL